MPENRFKTKDEARAYLRAALPTMREIQSRIDDRIVIRQGVSDGLITEDELQFAAGLEDTTPETIRKTTGTSPVAAVAQHIRYRRQLQAEPLPGFTEKLNAVQGQSIRGAVETVTGTAAYIRNMIEPVTRVTLDPLVDMLTGHTPRIRDRRNEFVEQARQQNEDILNFFGVGAEKSKEDRLFAAQQRSIAGLKPEPLLMYKLGGELLALAATSYVGGAATSQSRALNLSDALRMAMGQPLVAVPRAGALAVDALRAARVEQSASVLNRASQGVISVTEMGKLAPNVKGLLALAAGPGVGITSALWTAPDDADAMHLVERAMLGAGFGYLGISALMGRPSGLIAREMFLQERRLATALGKDAIGFELSGLAEAAELGVNFGDKLKRFGLKEALARGAFRFGNAIAYSPRTTVGHMLSSGALGASYETGKAIMTDGMSPEDAIQRGVMTGGAWMGFDWAAARIGGLQRTARLQMLWTREAANWFNALGFKPRTSQAIGDTLMIGQRAGIGAAVGAAVGGEDYRMRGAVAGAAAGLALLPFARAHLYSFLPKETVAKVIRGEFGRLTVAEATNVAETIFSGVTAKMARESNHPIYQSLRETLVGMRGEFAHELRKEAGIPDRAGPVIRLLAENAGPSNRGIGLPDTFDDSVQVRMGQTAPATSRNELIRSGRLLPEGAGASRRGETTPLPASGANDRFVFGPDRQLPPARNVEGVPTSAGPKFDELAAESARLDVAIAEMQAPPGLREAQERFAALGKAYKTAKKADRAAIVEERALLKTKIDELRKAPVPEHPGLNDAIARRKELDRILEKDEFGRPIGLHTTSGLTHLPESADSTVSEYVGRIKQRQAELLAMANQFEAEGRSTLDPDYIAVAREYGTLREQYARVLAQRGLDNPRANVLAREQFNVRTGRPGTSRIANVPENLEAEVAHVEPRLAKIDTLIAPAVDDTSGYAIEQFGNSFSVTSPRSGVVSPFASRAEAEAWIATERSTAAASAPSRRGTGAFNRLFGGKPQAGASRADELATEALRREPRDYVVLEDVTKDRLYAAETGYGRKPVKIGPKITATEQRVMEKLPDELDLGFVSNTLRYSPAIRKFPTNERTAIIKLLKRGKLRVERRSTLAGETEVLVKTRPTTPESGFQTIQSFAATGGVVAGIGGGLLVGPYIGDLIREDGKKRLSDGVLAAAVLGGMGALLGGLVANKLATREAEQVFKIIGTAPKKVLDRAAVAAKIGKSGIKLKTFRQLGVGVQVEHLTERLKNIAAGVAVDAKTRRDHLLRALNAFVPDALDPPLYDAARSAWQSAATAAGMTSEQAMNAWRGFLANFAIPHESRVFGEAADLFALGRRVGPLNKAGTWDELRQVFLAAKAVSGPELGGVRMSKALRDEMRRAHIVSKDAEALRGFADELDFIDNARSGVVTATLTRSASGIRPIESIRRNAIALIETGDSALGHSILAIHDAIAGASRDIDRMYDAATKSLNATLSGLTSEQIDKVRFIIEGGNGKTAAQWRATYTGHNDHLITAADSLSKQLRHWANVLRVPEDMLLEDYLPWYYSQATIRELKAVTPFGTQPTAPLTMGYGSGLPSTKFFKSMLARQRGTPLDGRITDLRELSQLYLYGAIRKYNLDKLLARVTSKQLNRIAAGGQRPLAADLQRLILDLHGVPSEMTMRMDSFLANTGMHVQKFSMFDPSGFSRKVADYLLENATDSARIAGVARGWEFYSKIGFNYTSALVNLTQLVINTGTEASFASIAGGVVDATRAAAARFGETAAGRSEELSFLLPITGPESKGADILRVIREQGVLSNRMLRTIDREADIMEGAFRPRGARVGGGVVGAFTGLAVPSDDTPPAVRAAAGFSAGVGAGYMAPRLVARGLRGVRLGMTGLFDGVEVFNRAASFGAFKREADRALQLAKTGATGKTSDVLRGALFGGVTGATIGAVQAEGGFNYLSPEAAIGAGVGVAAGVGGAALGEARATRVQRTIKQSQLDEIGDLLNTDAIAKQLAREKPSDEMIARFYARQMTEISQFRLGRAARGSLLRTPLGEAVGALQTYTLNQIEFTGQRMEQFMRSITHDLNTGQLRGTPADMVGNLDLRIFRHAALIGAMGATLTAVSGGLDSNHGWGYWSNRIGWGMMPFVRYREREGKWVALDPLEAFAGPLLSDFGAIVREGFWPLFDPNARQAFDESADNIADELVTFMRQAESNTDGLASILDKLQMEGIADLVREQKFGAARRISRPFSTIRRGQPVARGARGSEGSDPFGGAAGNDPFGGNPF